ncbi:hypothetical protein DPMN_026127 [Dreissena polymorpha]|uniref:Uncharacterized protein n=1 Tax=Dreissena polymorpha TaxID=45954 RepID=A0A9D4LST0_DREPO|nr:hypothetical protein DPMN_026127 [Dreissena polymorpha]
MYTRKLPRPPGSHVFQRTGTIFELKSQWTKNVTSRWPCISPIWTIFELVRVINKNNVFTKFHDDWANIVTSRVFTRKAAPPTDGDVFQLFTSFELDREDRTRVFTNQMWTDGRAIR